MCREGRQNIRSGCKPNVMADFTEWVETNNWTYVQKPHIFDQLALDPRGRLRRGGVGGGGVRGGNIRRRGGWPYGRGGCGRSCQFALDRARTFLRWRLLLR